MKVNSKPVKTKDSALTKDIKEIVLAKISTKQAIMVAIISLLSAVAVTTIDNLDKIRNTKSVASEEAGYYKGRASDVKRAFHEIEEEVQSSSKNLYDELRRTDVEIQELHTKQIEALLNERRLEASEIRTEINNRIWETNRKLQELERKRPELRKGIFRLIPNYGKRPVTIQEEVNNAV